jgi:hypothetical protein
MKGLGVSDACEDRLSTAPDLLKQAGIDSDCTDTETIATGIC